MIVQEHIGIVTQEIITNTVTFEKNQNVRKKGVDLKLGELVVKKNTVINSRIISSIASRVRAGRR